MMTRFEQKEWSRDCQKAYNAYTKKKKPFNSSVDAVVAKMIASGCPSKEFKRLKTLGLYTIEDLTAALDIACETKRKKI
jgi:hypothetical protein